MGSAIIYEKKCDYKPCSKEHLTRTLDLPDWPLVAFGDRMRFAFCSWKCLVKFAGKQGADFNPMQPTSDEIQEMRMRQEAVESLPLPPAPTPPTVNTDIGEVQVLPSTETESSVPAEDQGHGGH